jgi:uncharacterized protein YndB with AHSA1/START domain
MSETTSTPVLSSIVVNAPIDRTFSVFTQDIGSWWPAEHHILDGTLAEMVIEPRVGGHVYDRAVDGSECRWARVLAYEPPQRVVISWDVSLEWKLETDPAKTSEIEVRFVAETPQRTRVDLEHRNLHRHGPGWEQMHSAVGAPDGWTGTLRNLAIHLDDASVPKA